jgi:mannosyl-3-phosphoglycerate phosphatase family protein
MPSLTSTWWTRSGGFTSQWRAEHRQDRVKSQGKPDRVVLFSDPDTLRNAGSATWATMRGALAAFEDHNIAVVLWGNETRSEMELIRSDLNLHHPFISENGGGLFIPHGYFQKLPDDARAAPNYHVIRLGRPYYQVAEALHATAQKLHIDIMGFSDMSIEDVAQTCKLSLAQARLAKLREYDEPFRILSPDPSAYRQVCHALRRAGLRCFTHEAFHHASSVTDQALSLRLLTSLYRDRHAGRVRTIGVAKQASDVGLLQGVDIPLVLHNDETDAARVERRSPTAQFVGASAWCQAVLRLADGEPGAS